MMFKYCIKCGADLRSSVEDNFQRYVCSSCNWIYYNNPRPCATAIIHNNHEILFIRRAKDPGNGLWDFPGGFIEVGEHPETALKREVREELGISLDHFHFLGYYSDVYDIDNVIPILNITYICQIKKSVKVCTDEFDEIKWFPFSGCPEETAFSSMQTMIKDAIIILEKKIG